MSSRSSVTLELCCSNCRRVLGQIFSSNIADADGNSQKYDHSDQEAFTAAVSSCAFCNYLIENDTRYTREHLEQCATIWPRAKVIWQLHRDEPFPRQSAFAAPWTRLTVSSNKPDVQEYERILFCQFRLTADNGSRACQNGDATWRKGLHSSNSQEAFALLRSWLDHCFRAHSACLKSRAGHIIELGQDPLLPTRVLDVSDPADGVKLLESANVRGKYVALSHCWGPPGKVKPTTTIRTLPVHLHTIPLSQLSKTFQDAVAVVRAIGLRYLWIDSLCIVQDDATDWQREAEQMGAYFEQAHLTIAASAYHEEQDGLFSQWHRKPNILEIPYIERHGVCQGSVLLTQITQDRPNTFTQLQRRAWTAQEQVLSRRTIRYHDTSLVWECREAVTSDCGLNVPRLAPDLSNWQSFIEDYVKRKFTYPSDRLIAIHGLVKVLQPTRSDTYISGFWQADLPLQLLWSAEQAMTTTKDLSVFPSWSWASKLGFYIPFQHDVHPFSWRAACQVVGTKDVGRLRLFGKALSTYELQMVNLEAGWPTYPDEHPIPRMRHTIEGIIDWTDGMNDLMLPGGGYSLPDRLLMVIDSSNRACGWMILDLSDEFDGDVQLLLVALPVQAATITHGLVLVLQPSADKPGSYLRLGMGLVGGWLLTALSEIEDHFTDLV